MANRIYTFLILILLPISCFSQTDIWVKFDKALRDYVGSPTHENSIKAYELLPNRLNGGNFPTDKILNNIWLTACKLDTMIFVGNRDALRIEFRLYTIADGENAEGIDITIGKLINKNPLLFLQELRNHRQLVPSFGALVCNYGPDYVDNAKLGLTETDKRIKSLNKISDVGLIKTRDECILELRSHRKLLEDMLKEK